MPDAVEGVPACAVGTSSTASQTSFAVHCAVFLLTYFVFSRSTVNELPGKERLMICPVKLTLSVFGKTLTGSSTEFSSVASFDVSTIAVPSPVNPFAPFNSNSVSSALETELELNGAKGFTGEGTAIVLTSKEATDENSLEEPVKVFPKTESVSFTGQIIKRSFPGNSFTVLRLKTK